MKIDGQVNAIQALIGLDAPTLTTIKDSCVACIVAQTVRGYSYSIAGRSFSFPSLSDARDMLQAANYALGLLQGTRSENVRANFNSSMGRKT